MSIYNLNIIETVVKHNKGKPVPEADALIYIIEEDLMNSIIRFEMVSDRLTYRKQNKLAICVFQTTTSVSIKFVLFQLQKNTWLYALSSRLNSKISIDT